MVDCSGFIQPLDLECLLVNTFAESLNIFLFVAFIFIAVAGAYFRMLNSVVVLMYVIFALLFATFIPTIYFLFILIAGLTIAYLLSKIPKT